jgi:hypothetical protein
MPVVSVVLDAPWTLGPAVSRVFLFVTCDSPRGTSLVLRIAELLALHMPLVTRPVFFMVVVTAVAPFADLLAIVLEKRGNLVFVGPVVRRHVLLIDFCTLAVLLGLEDFIRKLQLLLASQPVLFDFLLQNAEQSIARELAEFLRRQAERRHGVVGGRQLLQLLIWFIRIPNLLPPFRIPIVIRGVVGACLVIW